MLKAEKSRHTALLEGVAWGGVATSAALAGVGVADIFGWSTWLTAAGSAIIVAGTMLTETAASRLPVAAQAHATAGSIAGWAKCLATIAGFAALTTWNVYAGHMGAETINRASVAEKRAPLELASAEAAAGLSAAERALADYDAETQRRAAARQQTIMGADGRYVTARSVAQAAAEAALDEREAARGEFVETIASNGAEAARAEIELRNAPAGLPGYQLWAFALILELIKGALVWFAAPVRRRLTLAGNVLPIEPAAYAEMSEAELTEIESRASAAKALAQHARRRLKKRAA